MEVKEGIVLDAEGQTLHTPESLRQKTFDGARVRILQFRASSNPFLLLLIPVVITIALALFIVIFLLAIPFWLIRRILR